MLLIWSREYNIYHYSYKEIIRTSTHRIGITRIIKS